MRTAEDVQPLLREMTRGQRYAVLATDDHGQPYTSLMAFAASADLKQMLLMTDRRTCKYANIKANRRVAVLLDDRENSTADTQNAVAVTAIGEAEEAAAAACASLIELYLQRHPHLADFARSPNCALVMVKVSFYLVVTRFQQVIEWRPA